MKPATSTYDTAGFGLWRTLRLAILHRLFPSRTSDFRGGPGWSCLARLLFWKTFGRILFALHARLELRSRAWRALTRGRF